MNSLRIGLPNPETAGRTLDAFRLGVRLRTPVAKATLAGRIHYLISIQFFVIDEPVSTAVPGALLHSKNDPS